MKAILVGFGFIGRSLVKTICLKKETLSLFDKEFKLIGASTSHTQSVIKTGGIAVNLALHPNVSNHFFCVLA